jgi:ribosome-interacting GTPase 1
MFYLNAIKHANKPAVAVNAQHVKQINKLMYNTTISYIKCFATSSDVDAANYSMYANDVAHNINALAQFNKDFNAQVLHNSIMQQDTLVREYYYKVLKYIENKRLITADRFCCK